MPRKKQRRENGSGSYRWDATNQRHIWRITRNGKRYEIADRDPTRAKARFKELLGQLDKNIDIGSGKQTLNTYMAYYLESVLPTRVSVSTLHDYAKRAGYYILPTLGDYRLTDLKKPLIQEWLNAMVDHGWAINSVAQALALLKRTLDNAVPEILEYNPAASIEAPQRPQHEDDDEDSGRALTPEDCTTLLAVVRGTFYEALYTIALQLGLRRGELLGLRWQDIDIDKQELRVRQQVRRLGKTIEITSQLKTRKGRRTLPFSDGVATILLAHMAIVEQMRRKNPAWEDRDLVFPNESGSFRRPDHLTKHTARLFKRLGIVGHHLHDLRATAITRWRELGADNETTAALAGHSSVKVSLEVYSDAEARKRVIVKKMND